jgi:hypothetical protein
MMVCMKRICRAPNIAIAQLWADTLGAEGIKVTVQRHYASSIAGDIPPDQALPELWAMRDEDLSRAQLLIAQIENAPMQLWICAECGERVEGAFESCWNCGAWKK